MKHLDWSETLNCVHDSFGSANREDWVKVGNKNSIIEKEISYWNQYGGNIVPSIVINNATYRG